MRIYIAGPMTGFPQFNFPAFDKATTEFRANGWSVFSPAEHDRNLLGKPSDWLPSESDATPGWRAWVFDNAPSLRMMLGADLQYICNEATAIYMLPGWEKSNGARAEHATAVALGHRIIYG